MANSCFTAWAMPADIEQNNAKASQDIVTRKTGLFDKCHKKDRTKFFKQTRNVFKGDSLYGRAFKRIGAAWAVRVLLFSMQYQNYVINDNKYVDYSP